MKSKSFPYIKTDGTTTFVEVFYNEKDQDQMDTSEIFFEGNELVDYLLEADFVLDIK